MNQEVQMINKEKARAAMKRMKSGKMFGPNAKPVVLSRREDSGHPNCLT